MVERDEDHAGVDAGQIDFEIAKIVLRQDRDAVAGRDAPRQHGAREFGGTGAQLAIGQPQRALLDRNAILMKRRRAREYMVE